MAQQNQRDRSERGGGVIFMLIVIGLIFLGGPIVLPSVFPKVVNISGLAQTMMVGFGILLLAMGSVMGAISSFYEKAASNEALVRTGMGGSQVILDGGCLVIPVVHKLRRVSLETVKLTQERTAKDALITDDKLRIDVKAEFYIRVNRTKEAVLAAASSLGDKAGDDDAIMALVGEKLISAMRTVAAGKDLDHLHTKLDEYRDEVKKIVEHDLEPNGLLLETVAISHLNQTSPEFLDPENNVFDAQGARKIAQITAEQRVARTKISTAADQEVKAQEVERDKKLFALGVEQATAKAQTDQQTNNAQAESTRKAAEFAAEQDQMSRLARVSADKAVEIAQVEKTQAIQIAAATQEKLVQTANIDKQQSVEVRQRDQQIAVAAKEKEKAVAEAARVAAQTEVTRQEQVRLTVEKTAEAERAKQIAITQKESTAAQTKIERNMQADVDAYTTVRAATAQQEAAEKQGAAQVTLATAEKNAASLRAEGQKAEQLVPVQVAGEQVEVERKKVEVERVSLENKSTYDKVSIQLTVRLAEIQANKEAAIERAKALGQALSSADMKIYGDPNALTAVLAQFYQGQAVGTLVGSTFSAVPTDVKDFAAASLKDFASAASSIVKAVFGRDMSADAIEAGVTAELARRAAAAPATSANGAAHS